MLTGMSSDPEQSNKELLTLRDPRTLGQGMYSLVERLYPICRSITGGGVRQTLAQVKKILPIDVFEVPTGTKVFDWTVPKEWNIKDAYIKNAQGERIVDFKQHNLHVVNYSVPVRKKILREELLGHLHTIPEQPDLIPYRTSYYNETWGFCLSHNKLVQMQDAEYEVCIDSKLEDGALTYGEFFVRGQSDTEILCYTHTCHPSLCNDNLSGISVVTFLADILRDSQLRYSYRFVFGPGTIGSITWLCRNETRLQNIKYVLVTALLGDPGNITYKKTRNGSHTLDRIVQAAFNCKSRQYNTLEFSPYGYDERQFSSPGINLPTVRITRSPNSGFPEYHTSGDNLDLIKPEFLVDSLQAILDIINIIDNNQCFVNLFPKCEPQLGKRGLYSKSGGQKSVGQRELALLWVLNMSDGNHDLLDIMEKSGLTFEEIYYAAQELHNHVLLRSADE